MATESQLEELRNRLNHDGGKVLGSLWEYRQGSSYTRFSRVAENAISTASNRVGVPRNLLKAVIHFSSRGDYLTLNDPERTANWVYLPFVGITFHDGRYYELGDDDWSSRYFAPNCLAQCVIAARELKSRAEDGGSWKSAVREYLSANRFDCITCKPWGKASESSVQRVLDLWKTYDEADIEYRDQGWGALVGWSTWSDLLVRKEKECKDLERQNSILKTQNSMDSRTIERLQRENAELRARNFAINNGLTQENDIWIQNRQLKEMEASRDSYRSAYFQSVNRAAKQASEIKFLENEVKALTDKHQVAEKRIQSLEKDHRLLQEEVGKRNAALKSVKEKLIAITAVDFDTSSVSAVSRAKQFARDGLAKMDGLILWGYPEGQSMKSGYEEKFKEEVADRVRTERMHDAFSISVRPFPRTYEFPPKPPVKTQEERISTLEIDVQGLKMDVAKNAIKSSLNSMKIDDMERNQKLFGPPHPDGYTGSVNSCGCKGS